MGQQIVAAAETKTQGGQFTIKSDVSDALWQAGSGYNVTITGSGDNSGVTFVVTGVDKDGTVGATERLLVWIIKHLNH